VTDASESSTDLPKKPEHRTLAIALAYVAVAALVFAAFTNRWLYAGATQLQIRDGDLVIPVGGHGVHEVGFGLRTMFECKQGDCEALTNRELLDHWVVAELSARYVLGETVGDDLTAAGGDPHALDAQRVAITDPIHPDRELQRLLTYEKQAYVSSSTFVTFGWITLIALVIAAISLATAATLVVAKKRVALPIMPTTTALLGVGVALITGCLFVATKPGPPGYVGVGISFFAFGAGVILGLWSTLYLNKLLRPADPDLLEDSMNPDQF
jgi:hypothetical protein